MTIQHSAIPDAQLHEPKGVVGASANQVYMADGGTSGTWKHHAGSVHGEIYLESASISVGPTGGTITSDADYRNVGATWAQFTDAANTSLHTDNKAIKVSVTGHYMISAFVSFTTGAVAAGTDYSLKYRVNDSATLSVRKLAVGKETAGSDRITISGTALVLLTAEDYVDLMLGSSTADTVTVTDAGITVILLNET